MEFDRHRMEALMEGQSTSRETQMAQERAALKELYGPNYEKRLEDAVKVAMISGEYKEDELHDIMENPRTLKAFASLAPKFGEDRLRAATTATGTAQTNLTKANDAMTNANNPLFQDYQGANGEGRQMRAQAIINTWLQEPDKFTSG